MPSQEDIHTEQDRTEEILPSVDTSKVPAIPVQRPFDIRVLSLGFFLVFMIVLSVFAVASLVMADTDQESITCLEKSGRSACKEIPENQQKDNSAPLTTSENTNVSSGGGPINSPVASPTRSLVSISATPTPAQASVLNPISTTPTPSFTPAVKPSPSPNKQSAASVTIPPKVAVYGLGVINADSYVALIVIFSGMLGAVIRVNYSFYKHLGFGDFTFNWLWFYLLLPFFGPALALVFYFVIRGGFYSSASGEGLTLNLYSFAALGALTGLFSENAMEKLRQVAVTLLADTPPKVRESKALVEARDSLTNRVPKR